MVCFSFLMSKPAGPSKQPKGVCETMPETLEIKIVHVRYWSSQKCIYNFSKG